MPSKDLQKLKPGRWGSAVLSLQTTGSQVLVIRSVLSVCAGCRGHAEASGPLPAEQQNNMVVSSGCAEVTPEEHTVLRPQLLAPQVGWVALGFESTSRSSFCVVTWDTMVW